jgi:hypothetical protein
MDLIIRRELAQGSKFNLGEWDPKTITHLRILISQSDSYKILHLIEHQRPNLDALPGVLILLGLIDKRTMRHPSRHILPRIKALDECHLIGSLRVLEVPLVVGIRPHRVRLTLASGINQRHPDQIRLRDGLGRGNAEGVFEDGFDGAPDLFFVRAYSKTKIRKELYSSMGEEVRRERLTLIIWNLFCSSSSASSGK